MKHGPDVVPMPIDAVPVVVERSAATAVSPVSNDAVQVTVTASEAAADSVSGKLTSAPSVAEAFPTLSVGRTAAASVVPLPESDHAPVPSALVARTCTS